VTPAKEEVIEKKEAPEMVEKVENKKTDMVEQIKKKEAPEMVEKVEKKKAAGTKEAATKKDGTAPAPNSQNTKEVASDGDGSCFGLGLCC